MTSKSEAIPRDRFYSVLALICGVAVVTRVAYLGFQASVDPWFSVPTNDAKYFVDWARSIVEHGTGPSGAYYLAPLYPMLMSLLWFVAGPSLPLIYVLQHGISIATAAVVAIGGRHVVGPRAALFAAALFVFHHPLIYFASRIQGETLAIGLLLWAVVDRVRRDDDRIWHVPLLLGLATLARPNLLLIALLWIAADVLRRRWRRAFVFGAIFVLTLAPIAVRNFVASGHFVPVSANGGMTLYHGNGRDAGGQFTGVPGMVTDVTLQRSEATRFARMQSGDMSLDDVEADAWWARQAIEERIGHPIDSLGLLGRRVLLTAANYEIGLESYPALDPTPSRLVFRLGGSAGIAFIPFALLLGLSATVVFDRRWRRKIPVDFWLALLGCLATPLLFYVSSRYRVPLTALMCVPAGLGVERILAENWGLRSRATIAGIAVLLGSLGLSALVDVNSERVGYHRNASQARLDSGDIASALLEAREAVRLGEEDAGSHCVLGIVLERSGEFDGAIESYREALRRDEYFAFASEALSRLLARRGDTDEAIEVLERALRVTPSCRDCWYNLMAVWIVKGDPGHASEVRGRMRAAGFAVPDHLKVALDQLMEAQP
ncbi:MAG: tetratricopeptide repeat protein [Acidobacteriota bacterium]|nr:tetratricopeptide repeat protein [Acidobacteriota bacterium]